MPCLILSTHPHTLWTVPGRPKFKIEMTFKAYRRDDSSCPCVWETETARTHCLTCQTAAARKLSLSPFLSPSFSSFLFFFYLFLYRVWMTSCHSMGTSLSTVPCNSDPGPGKAFSPKFSLPLPQRYNPSSLLTLVILQDL